MMQSYSITGMSCDGCRTNVEGINAEVSLHPPIATVKMDKHIAAEQLQQVLKTAEKYCITATSSTEKNHHS